MSRFFSTYYSNLEPYTPGEQPQDKKYIKLNTNESPFPPAPAVIDVIDSKAVADLRLYSDPTLMPLKKTIAERYEVNPDQVFITNGSDDALNFSFMAFSQDGIAFPDITYGFYQVFAALNHIGADVKPLKDDFSIDVNEYENLNKAIVIANPNAPTGMTLTDAQIRQILDNNKDHVVIIDEAYVDFGGETAIPLTKEYKNLLVIQTFSKSRSLAGARVGYAIGDQALIQDLETLRFSTNPYNVNRLSMAAAVEAMKSVDYYKENCKTIIENREFTKKELEKRGFTCTDSKANFLFAKSDRITGKDLYLKLKDRGILIRHFDSERICEYNRITIGTHDEMQAMLDVIDDLLK